MQEFTASPSLSIVPNNAPFNPTTTMNSNNQPDTFEISRPSGWHRFRAYLQLMGAGSLTLSILLHAVGLLLFTMFVWTKSQPSPPPPPNFIANGSAANGTDAVHEKNQRKLHQANTSSRIICFTPSAVTLQVPSP